MRNENYAGQVVALLGKDVIDSPLFRREMLFTQHGMTTTYEHSLDVAKVAVLLAAERHVLEKVNLRELVVMSLLHDYFLYDWHRMKSKDSLHGLTHGAAAASNAMEDFGNTVVTEKVWNGIAHHMFPLTSSRPGSMEGWLVCAADKMCALRESFFSKKKKSPTLLLPAVSTSFSEVPSESEDCLSIVRGLYRFVMRLRCLS